MQQCANPDLVIMISIGNFSFVSEIIDLIRAFAKTADWSILTRATASQTPVQPIHTSLYKRVMWPSILEVIIGYFCTSVFCLSTSLIR